ncbi:MAG: hypothetical protein JNK48_08390 [Bryobacterales bacterium]|nr:hypothetical protein [Bryobacterales bacterium]
MHTATTTETHTIRQPLQVSPLLDEARWQAWVQKGLARDRRNYAARLNGIKGISTAALLAGAALNVSPDGLALRFIVTAGSVFVMWQAAQARRFAFAAVFAALALLYNPLLALLGSFGGWQRAAMVASTIPFVLSLAWGSAGHSVKEKRAS